VTTVYDADSLAGQGDHVNSFTAEVRTLVMLDLGKERRRKLVEVEEVSALPRCAQDHSREEIVAIQVHLPNGGSHATVGNPTSPQCEGARGVGQPNLDERWRNGHPSTGLFT